MGDHAVTHCAPRLRKVIEGEQGGISQAANWQGGGGFRFYRLGPTIFNAEGQIRPGISFPQLAAHIWFTETRTPLPKAGWPILSPCERVGSADSSEEAITREPSPYLGTHNGTAYYLLYNGVLGDRRPQNGNVLTRAVLANLPAPPEGATNPRMIYGESCRLSPATLERENITFKQTPYEIKAA